MKVKTLSRSEVRDLNSQITRLYGIEKLLKNDFVNVVENKFKYVTVNNEVMFFYHENMLIPALKTLLKGNFTKKISVDMGAVKFVCSGADIMRPGIIGISEGILKGSVVSIVDEKYGKPMAVGLSLYSTSEMKAMEKGKAVRNIHYAGDEIWNL